MTKHLPEKHLREEEFLRLTVQMVSPVLDCIASWACGKESMEVEDAHLMKDRK